MSKCSLCGEPMPPGEEMFMYHGYSGPCPKPPLEPVVVSRCCPTCDALAAENAALREENERLTAANKARAEYLTTRRAGNDVDSYVNLAETKIEELRAQLAEAQEELAQWRATGESVTRNEYVLSARLAETEALLREAQTYGIPSELYRRIDAHLARQP